MIIELRINGPIKGGKNNIVITKQGRRFPSKKWVEWREQAINQIKPQIPNGFQAIDNIGYKWEFVYTPEDNRRRDLPAILDAIFHVLEKLNIVVDDCLIKNVCFVNKAKDVESAGVTIKVYGVD